MPLQPVKVRCYKESRAGQTIFKRTMLKVRNFVLNTKGNKRID